MTRKWKGDFPPPRVDDEDRQAFRTGHGRVAGARILFKIIEQFRIILKISIF